MINGTYCIIMKTPMGKKSGQLTLHEDENELTGFIDILGNRNTIRNGTIKNGECRFSGVFETFIRNISFSAEGNVNEKEIFLVVKAGKLHMHISGKRIADG